MQRISAGLAVIVLVAFCGFFAGTPEAEAQLPVIDAANLSQNSISATNLLINTAQWALNLLGLPQFAAAAGSFVGSMQKLQAIVADAQALGFDILMLQSQLDSLFDLGTAPATSTAFAMRMGEIRVLVFLTYSYAMRTQNLITTTLDTVADALTLINHLMAVLGVVQGTQVIAQYQQQLLLVQSELKVSTKAFQRAVRRGHQRADDGAIDPQH